MTLAWDSWQNSNEDCDDSSDCTPLPPVTLEDPRGGCRGCILRSFVEFLMAERSRGIDEIRLHHRDEVYTFNIENYGESGIETKQINDTMKEITSPSDNLYESGVMDFMELLYRNAMALSVSAEGGAALGAGVNVSAGTTFNGGSRHVSGEYVKGFGAFAGAVLSGDVFSSGNITGVIQASRLCAGAAIAACASFTWDATGNWSISTAIGLGAGVKYDAFTIGYKYDF